MRLLSRTIIALLCLRTLCIAAPNQSVLPKAFSGWQQDQATLRHSNDPSAADANNASVLKEYGFSDLESATYTRDSNRKLTLKVARFNDATGAYGAFTFYRDPQMLTETIGDHGVSSGSRVLFFRGNLLADAEFDHVTAMSAAELRALAEELPLPAQNLRHIPDLARYFPQESFVLNSTKYVVGPVAMQKVQSVIPASSVDFARSAEVAIGNYKTSDGIAAITLIYCPTPQIAGNQMRALEHLRATFAANGGSQFELRRTGPLVAIASGSISESEARSLLAAVNYEADVTYNEPTFLGKRDNIGNLIIGIFTLIGVILFLALIIGVGFGGFRVLMKKLYPHKVFDRDEDVEFISLNLRR
jgi:Family of unknown function (DUF6599)